MNNAFIRLADRINSVYQLGLGRHREDSAFVQVFYLLLGEEEAETALLLDDNLKTSAEAAQYTDWPEREIARDLASLSRKGIIYERIEGEQSFYRLMPFVPGIFENLIGISDRPEIAGCLQKYAEEVRQEKEKRSQRIIPVNCEINVRIHSVPLEEIELYINNTDRYAVMDCICRTVKAAQRNACGHPIRDMCILIGEYTEHYIRNGNARAASKQEVLDILRQAEAAGLYHEMYPIERTKSAFICNCCTCGCMFMGVPNRIKEVLSYTGSIQIDRELCDGCGRCLEQCPEHVFSWNEDQKTMEMDASLCFKCGLCEILCEKHAIQVWD